MKLWLLRHARVLVEPGVCYGASELDADPAATEAAAQEFAAVPGQGCVLWTSPSTRAQLLASAIHRLRPDIGTPRTDTRLQEMDFGDWEMQAWSGIPRADIDRWVADFPDHRFGGKESAQEVIDRVAAALADASDLAVPEMAWVTHAGVIRAVQFLQAAGKRQRIASAGEWPASVIGMGEWVCVDWWP